MKNRSTTTKRTWKGASIRPSTFLTGDQPGPLVEFRPSGLRNDRLTLSLALPVYYAAQHHGSGRPPGHVVQRALGTGLARLQRLRDYQRIDFGLDTIGRGGAVHDLDLVQDWRLDVWHSKSKTISLRNVDPALIARRAKLAEVLGLPGIASTAVAIGLVDDAEVPAPLRRGLEAGVSEFLTALESRAAFIEEFAKRFAGPVDSSPVTTWERLVDGWTGTPPSTRPWRGRGRG